MPASMRFPSNCHGCGSADTHIQIRVNQIMATLKKEGESRVYRVNVASDVPIAALLPELCRQVGWIDETLDNISQVIVKAEPPGRTLKPDETLASAQCPDGVWLVLSEKERPALNRGFIWRQMDDVPPPAGGEVGYQWRQLDGDPTNAGSPP